MAQPQDEIQDINAFHLDKKVIWIWALSTIIPSIIILIFVLVVSVLFTGNILGIASSEFPLWVFGFLLVVNIIYISWLHLEYYNYIYYFTKSSVIIKQGVITTDRHVIPFERIQDLHISRSIIERFLNLASIKIETAAPGSYVQKHLIPAVSNYRSIISFIMDKRKKHKSKSLKSSIDGNNEVISLLKELVGEVKGLKNVLSKEKDTKDSVKGSKYEEFDKI